MLRSAESLSAGVAWLRTAGPRVRAHARGRVLPQRMKYVSHVSVCGNSCGAVLVEQHPAAPLRMGWFPPRGCWLARHRQATGRPVHALGHGHSRASAPRACLHGCARLAYMARARWGDAGATPHPGQGLHKGRAPALQQGACLCTAGTTLAGRVVKWAPVHVMGRGDMLRRLRPAESSRPSAVRIRMCADSLSLTRSGTQYPCTCRAIRSVCSALAYAAPAPAYLHQISCAAPLKCLQ